MAVIPRADSLASPAQNTRRVVDVPVVEENPAIWREVARAGKQLQEFGARIQKAEIDRKVVEADRKTREDLDREYRKLADSGDDPEDFEARYREATNKVIAQNASLVPQGGRALWSQRAKDWQSDGIIQTRTLQRQRQLEGVRAGVIAEMGHLADSIGDMTITAETYAENIAAQKGHIDRLVQEGVIGKDDAARHMIQLDGYRDKDMLTRKAVEIETLVQAGQADRAAELIKDDALTAAQRKELKQVKDAAEAEMRAAEAQARADLDRAQTLNANRLEIDIIDGKAGRRQINEAAARGDISENDVPALIRAHREEQKRREAEAGLSAAEKAALADWSLDALQMLDTSPQIYLIPMDQWPKNARDLYEGMDRDRQRAVRQRVIDAVEKGQTQNAAMAIYSDLVARAKPLIPEDWKLSSEAALGEGDGLKFSSILFDLAKRYSAEGGGRAIKESEAREIVARALNEFKPYDASKGFFGPAAEMSRKGEAGGYRLPQDIVVKDYLNARFSPLGDRVWAALKQKTGRDPTKDEFMTAYDQVR